MAELPLERKPLSSHPSYPARIASLVRNSPFSQWWNFATQPLTTPPGSNSYDGNVSSTDEPTPPAFSLFPQNPSIGLRLFTPIVPASDNKPALFLVSTFQLLLGLTLMARRVPKIGESRLVGRLSGITRFVAGSGLVLLSGLEYARMMIPYDPWSVEAQKWRHWAVKSGYKPSWWYGAINWYTPMLMDEWKTKTTIWVNNAANALDSLPETANSDTALLTNISIGPHATLKAGESNTYYDIYSNLRLINEKRAKELLLGKLAKVTELNKAERLDLLMEGKGDVHLNEDYAKPNIQLGLHTFESGEEFEMVWANFEPWDEMGQETDFDIRLIPQWRIKDANDLDAAVGES